MTDTVLGAARIVPARATRKLSRRAAVAIRRLLSAYWDYQVRRATIVMLYRLDDRTLADIGIDRSEIESFVIGRTRDGKRCSA